MFLGRSGRRTHLAGRDELRPFRGVGAAPVVREHRIVRAADRVVGVGGPPEVDHFHGRSPQLGVGVGAHHRPRRVVPGQGVEDLARGEQGHRAVTSPARGRGRGRSARPAPVPRAVADRASADTAIFASAPGSAPRPVLAELQARGVAGQLARTRAWKTREGRGPMIHRVPRQRGLLRALAMWWSWRRSRPVTGVKLVDVLVRPGGGSTHAASRSRGVAADRRPPAAGTRSSLVGRRRGSRARSRARTR